MSKTEYIVLEIYKQSLNEQLLLSYLFFLFIVWPLISFQFFMLIILFSKENGIKKRVIIKILFQDKKIKIKSFFIDGERCLFDCLLFEQIVVRR